MIKVTAKNKKYDKYAKMIETLMQTHEFNFMAEVSSEIATKLVCWEMILGEKMAKEIISAYLEKK